MVLFICTYFVAEGILNARYSAKRKYCRSAKLLEKLYSVTFATLLKVQYFGPRTKLPKVMYPVILHNCLNNLLRKKYNIVGDIHTVHCAIQ